MEKYHFQLEKFQGPLDLLLQLIEEERLNITEISLAKIADQYIRYIEEHPVNPEQISEFLIIASRLLLAKSREILPDLTLTSEEEEDIQELQDRLCLYQKFKQLAFALRKLEQRGEYCVEREVPLSEKGIFLAPHQINVALLRQKIRAFLKTLPSFGQTAQKTIAHAISLQEKIKCLEKILEKRMELALSHLLLKGDREERIVIFLALLELCKKGKVFAEQDGVFTEIILKKGGALPRPREKKICEA